MKDMASCPMCGREHRLTECHKFLHMSSRQRIKFVWKNDCCLCCLSVTHRVAQCPSPVTCTTCRGAHNSLVHRERNSKLPPENIHSNQSVTSPAPLPAESRSVRRSPPARKRRLNSPQKEKYSCPMCGVKHRLIRCPTFLCMGPKQKIKFVWKNDCCLCCLSTTHRVAQCPSPERCKKCEGEHNTLIHHEVKSQLPPETKHSRQQPTTPESPQASSRTARHSSRKARHPLRSARRSIRTALRSSSARKRNLASPQRESDLCRVCGKGHHLTQCNTFLRVGIHQRLSIARDIDCCLRCLSAAHGETQCPFSVRCKICGGDHNTLIHREAVPQLPPEFSLLNQKLTTPAPPPASLDSPQK